MTAGDLDSLLAFLREWDNRRRQQELWRWLPRGLLAGLLMGLAAALLSRERPLLTRGELALFSLAVALIALSLTGMVILLRRRAAPEQARFADRQFGLQERMTTAVEIADGRLPVETNLAARQLRDAVSTAASVDAARLMPRHVELADWLPALAAVAALALVLWLPNPQESVLLEQRTVGELVEQQVEALTTLNEEIAANEALTPEQQAALQQPLEEALATLEEPGLSREEAVAALSQAEGELRALNQQFDTASLNEALADAAAALSDEDVDAPLAEALREGQLTEAAAAAEALGATLEEMSAAEREALAERLAASAAALQATDPALASSLSEAAEALAEGDTPAAQEALGETAATLGERAESAAAATQAASAAEQLGAARGEVAQSGAGEQPGDGGEGAGGQDQTGTGESGSTTGSGGEQSGTGGPSEGGGHVENVFVPDQAAIEGQGTDLELEVQCLADPESCGPIGGQTPSDMTGQSGGSSVPYDQVFGNYRDAAIEALSSGDIPIGLQDIIRDYFSALEP